AGWHARASRIAMSIAVLVTVSATVTAARVLYAYASVESNDASVISYVASIVFEFPNVPLAVLGVVAIRRLPNRYFVPELLIGVGALAASVAWSVWSASIFFASSSSPSGVGVAAVVTALVIQLLAMALVALGFFAGRVSAAGVT
ncbi:MAG TPA: hypothetical protein VJY85_06180, partial [Candidatus Limnocylindria bacterium]|nr:hypothetical protein [Candidatus Limnocylindria bacterium]